MGYLDIVHEFKETVRANEESPKVNVSDSELSERSERSDLNTHTSLNSHSRLSPTVIVGPWEPATAEQITNERRRVLEEEPRRWWWQPRYRLAELERGGPSRAEAVQAVREEAAGTDTVTVSLDDRHEAEGTAEGHAE